jgi:hypothetical protein
MGWIEHIAGWTRNKWDTAYGLDIATLVDRIVTFAGSGLVPRCDVITADLAVGDTN